jgi:CHAT domain-containing protein
MSLWKVDDEATKYLMASYYRKLVRGEPPSAALRQVQLAMSRHPRFSHPSYWAAFIPVGRSGKIPGLQ